MYWFWYGGGFVFNFLNNGFESVFILGVLLLVGYKIIDNFFVGLCFFLIYIIYCR